MKAVISILGFIAFCTGAMAAPPAWWSDPPTAIIEPGASENNYAPANIGQLKHVATQATKYLELRLGPAPSNVPLFDPTENPTTLSPVNIGQLKATAKPFYDWINSVPGNALQVPWTVENVLDDNNYGMANLGQLKNSFSFSLTDGGQVDLDGDGLADGWEQQLIDAGLTDQNGDGTVDLLDVDPADNFDQDEFTNFEEYQGALDPVDPLNGVTEPETVIPPAPGRPKIIENAEHTIASISWKDRSNNELLFFVERTEDGINWNRVKTLPKNTTTWQDTTLDPNQVYYYRIVSRNNIPE